jgi:hypothetical protein
VDAEAAPDDQFGADGDLDGDGFDARDSHR